VAIKLLANRESLESDTRKRLRHEARAAAILNHPSIVAVFDYDEQDGVPFIVYEYVEGKTLDRIIKEEPMTYERIIDIGSQLAAALEYAHERGILHRDIKPQNIMVTGEGRAKILDFGLAKRTKLDFVQAAGRLPESSTVETRAGTIVGTVEYMSPEQIGGEKLDGRTDIFSLGIVLYEMATGENPFHGQNFASIVGKIMSSECPIFPDRSFKFSSDLREVILRCLQKKREDRYPGSRMLVLDLERLKHTGPRARLSAAEMPQDRTDAVISRPVARVLLLLLQAAYLSIYGIALYYHSEVLSAVAARIMSLPGRDLLFQIATPNAWTTMFLVTGCCGIPVRLYLMVSVGFDDPEIGVQFRKLFPFLFVLDELWALSPLLLIDKWPAGIALVFMAVLAYLPLSQRTLIRNSYAYDGAERSG
jgi:hypothetical protein